MRTNVLQEIIVDGQTAGPGNPSVDITDAHGEIFFQSLCHLRLGIEEAL